MKKRGIVLLFALILLTSGCSVEVTVPAGQTAYIDSHTLSSEVEITDEAVALAGAPAVHTLLLPEAPGRVEKRNSKAVIDYSNSEDGYVMVTFTAATEKRLKVKVAGPTTDYTYNLTAQQWTTFPLSDGNGSYKVTVYENTTGTKYAAVLSVSFKAILKDEFAPFLRPNQYVDYAGAEAIIAKAEELAGAVSSPLEKVEKIYSFVVENLSYDKAKARTVKSGYLPVLDEVLEQKRGICFDYAALMTAMLRSQGVPCKLVVGYAGSAYHAWINVWTEETGWVDGAVYFDGSNWQRMDPTFASSSNNSDAIKQYIGDGSHYRTKYLY